MKSFSGRGKLQLDIKRGVDDAYHVGLDRCAAEHVERAMHQVKEVLMNTAVLELRLAAYLAFFEPRVGHIAIWIVG